MAAPTYIPTKVYKGSLFFTFSPVFLPGESQGRGSLVGCHLWGRTESVMTANHQRNANQNHNEKSPHTCQNGYHQSLEMTNTGENVKKREPLYTLVGM